MPILAAQLARVTLTANAAAVTAYTAPAAGAMVKNIVLTRGTGADATVTVSLGGIALLDSVLVRAGSALTIDVTQILTSGQTITATSAGANCNLHVAGATL